MLLCTFSTRDCAGNCKEDAFGGRSGILRLTFIPLSLQIKMRHDPEGMLRRPHVPLARQGAAGCTPKSSLRLEKRLAATAAALYPLCPVGQKCGVGSGHPKGQGENAGLMNWENNSAVVKKCSKLRCLGWEAACNSDTTPERTSLISSLKFQKGDDGGFKHLKYPLSDLLEWELWKAFLLRNYPHSLIPANTLSIVFSPLMILFWRERGHKGMYPGKNERPGGDNLHQLSHTHWEWIILLVLHSHNQKWGDGGNQDGWGRLPAERSDEGW